ncbi:uncharacterized protein LOC130745158 isoform X2 [Lotus japonicus]|uniref:uncharacterized protein LOC130745158 isoform X2 n=1 Tax=Lotus japonicus TaxID=34305 RepID=UPI0025907D63|nr:uncharacterized protein LOC130745158 isoform X2 [Lotus japonicus]
MLVYGVSLLELNWLLGLLGLAKKKAPNISDQSSNTSDTEPWSLLFILLAIVVGLGWLHFHQLDENREHSPSVNEQEEHSSGESSSSHYFDEDPQLRPLTATRGGAAGRRGACTLCGNLSTTRCSRCKVARYCHWRSGHQYECCEIETEADQARDVHDHGSTSMLVEKPEMESISNPSQGDVVESSDVSSGSDVNKFHGCEVCGSSTTTKCPQCKAVKYCSLKCLIMDRRWHKNHCIAMDVNSSPTETPDRNNRERYFEEEATKSRNEIFWLRSECDKWKKKANLSRETLQSFKEESEHQLSVLENEKESMFNAEKKACNMIHSLQERLNHMQIKVQESTAEKIKLEEHLQTLESECAKLKTKFQEEHKHAQYLKVQADKNHEAGRIAKEEVEAIRQELQEEREHVLRLKEDFLRDVAFAESRADFAEAKLNDLRKKIRLTDYKVPIVKDSLGRPAMACTICLTNEQDMAFGCGHMKFFCRLAETVGQNYQSVLYAVSRSQIISSCFLVEKI